MRRAGMVGRRGPGLLGTMARTAVVAGTASAVARGVSGSMDQRATQQQAAAQQQQQPTASPGTITDDTIARLQKLGEMQIAGLLTPEEFAQQKARLLGS
jgi:hypothetical protein